MKYSAAPLMGPVTALAFSEDGELLYAARGSCLIATAVERGAQVAAGRCFDGHAIHGISVHSLHGEPIAVVFGHKRVRVASLIEKSFACPLASLPASGDFVWDARLMDGERAVAVGLAHNFVEVWALDLSSCAGEPPERLLRVMCAHERGVLYHMALRETDGVLCVAAGTIYSHILVWELPPGGAPASGGSAAQQHAEAIVRERLEGHEGSVYRVRWSPCGSMLASASDDRTVRLWRLAHAGQQAMLLWTGWGHEGRVWDVEFCGTRATTSSPESIVSCSEDGTARVWDGEQGACLSTLRGHCGKHVWRLAVRRDDESGGSTVVTGGHDSAVKLWALPRHEQCCFDGETAKRPYLDSFPLPVAVPSSLAITVEAEGGCTQASPPRIAPAVSKGQVHGRRAAAAEGVSRVQLLEGETGTPTMLVSTSSGTLWMVLLSTGSSEWQEIRTRAIVPNAVDAAGISTFAVLDTLPATCGLIAFGSQRGELGLIDSVQQGGVVATWCADSEHRRVLNLWWRQCPGGRLVDGQRQAEHAPGGVQDLALFSSGVDGQLKWWEWRPSPSAPECRTSNNGRVPALRARFQLERHATVSCFSTFTTQEGIVCGDNRGNLSVFRLVPRGSSNVAPIPPVFTLSGAHGRDQAGTPRPLVLRYPSHTRRARHRSPGCCGWTTSAFSRLVLMGAFKSTA